MASSARARVLVRITAVVVVALLPVMVVALSSWSALTGIMVLGMLPTLNAIAAGARAMAAGTVASVAVVVLSVFANATGPWLPVVGTLLVAALGFATGAVAPRGLHPTGAATITLAAYLLVDPSQVVRTLDEHGGVALVAVQLAGIVLIGCLWALATVAVLLRGLSLPSKPVVTTLPYGILLAVLCGAFTLACLLWLPGTNAWWAVMTVALVLQPTRDDTSERLGGRLLGTILGGTAAAVVATVLPLTVVTVMIAVLCSLVGVLLLLSGAAYWKSATAASVGVILLTFEPAAVWRGDLERIVVTLVAAAVTGAAVWIATRWGPAS